MRIKKTKEANRGYERERGGIKLDRKEKNNMRSLGKKASREEWKAEGMRENERGVRKKGREERRDLEKKRGGREGI